METLEFIKPHRGKKPKKMIRSRYSDDGSYAKKLPSCRTVGELRLLLAQLPDSLPINKETADDFEDPDDFDDNGNGCKPVWFNVGDCTEHLSLERNDGTFA